MKHLSTFLLITLSVQFAGAEVFGTDSLVNRYRTTSEAALRTQVAAGAGEAVVGVTALSVMTGVSRTKKALAVSRELSPLVDAVELMTQIAKQRKTYEGLASAAIDETSETARGNRTASLEDLGKRIEENEMKLSQLRTSQAYTGRLDYLDETLLKADEMDIEEFLKQAKNLSKEERALIERAHKRGKGVLKRVSLGIASGLSAYVLVDGATRYLIATQAERDPTIFPMGGVLSWVAGETGEAAVAVKDGSVDFVTKTVPEKVTQAHKAVVNKYNSLRGGVDEEIEKVEESLRDPSSDKN